MAVPHEHQHGTVHVASVKMLLAVFLILILLTILTVFTAGTGLGPFAIWVSMGIATVKATLVALFFMHMWWEKGFNVLVFLSSFLFVSLFIGLTLMDSSHYQDTIDKFPRAPESITAPQ